MNHNFKPTEPSLTKSKREFVRLVGLQQYVLGSVLIPAKMYSSVEMMFHFLVDSGVSFNTYVQVIAGFGFTLLYDLIKDMKIKSYFELLKIMNFIRKSIPAFVEYKDHFSPFFPTDMLPKLVNDFYIRHMSKAEQDKFLKYLITTTTQANQGICIHPAMYAAIWKVWDERTRNGQSR
jgi:hypothetical protein